MTTPLDTAVLAGMQAALAAAGRPVTIRRGASASVARACAGAIRGQALTEDGRVIEFESRDYLMPAASYAFDAVAVEPQRGDRVEEPIGLVTQVYEVAPPGPGDNCFRYMDPQRQWLRVHTKHVSTA
jgi:hypothetical protein